MKRRVKQISASPRLIVKNKQTKNKTIKQNKKQKKKKKTRLRFIEPNCTASMLQKYISQTWDSIVSRLMKENNKKGICVCYHMERLLKTGTRKCPKSDLFCSCL